MSVSSVVTCEHPHDEAESGCGACYILELHSVRCADTPCRTCDLIHWANGYSPADRPRMLAEAVTLLAADLIYMHPDLIHFEAEVRRCLLPPVVSPSDLESYQARQDELVRMSYADYLRTPEWAEHRRRALVRAEHRCQGCDTPDNLEAHHRTYERRGEEDEMDLTVLCSACHTAVHLVADGRRGKVRRESKRARA